jgi:hypothetical protein
MNIKYAAGDTCVWCVAVVVAALSLLTVTWTAILVSS